MSKLHQPFTALAQGKTDFVVDVEPIVLAEPSPFVPFEPLMCVMASEEAIYITKQQAMDFFGLVEPTVLPISHPDSGFFEVPRWNAQGSL